MIMVAALCLGLSASPAPAVKTAVWLHEQPKDFVAGKLDNVVASSLGEVALGRRTEPLYAPPEAEVINALARAGDGKVYAATGPNGVIYQIDGDRVTEFARLPDGGTVLSLLFARDGKLLAGSGGGSQARIHRIDGTGKATVFYEPKDARYIWAMARGPSGEIYAATGTEGQLYAVDADGSNGRVLVDLKPKNLLCLAIGPDGMLYAGTDGDGLVYRINPAEGKAFVMYDAEEPEISAVVLDSAGNVFASTAAADAARPGRAVADKPGGKPDHSVSKPSLPPEAGSTPAGPKTAPSASRPGRHESSLETRPSAAADDGSNEKNNGNRSAGQEQRENKEKEKEEEVEQEKKPAPTVPVPRRLGRPVAQGKAAGAGNAIYRIDTDGFVTEVFREPLMILAMAEAEGTIYVATGNEGRIYAVTPAEDRTAMLAKLEPSQATALLRLPTGRLVVGTANAALLVRISDRCAEKGTLLSKPLDAGQIVKWGRVKWDASVPGGTKLTIAVRSSNVEDEESEAWDDWSPEMDATSPQQIPAVSARFLQYRLTFETTVPHATPTARKIRIARIEENRAPRIAALSVGSAREEARKPGAPSKVKAAAGLSMSGESEVGTPDYYWVVKWKAEDPNKDPLLYDVFYREVGTTRWVRMAQAEEIDESLHIWDTRTVADGKYEVRVVAKDSKANPPGTELTDARISDPIIVDNTPPDVTIEELAPAGTDSLTVHASLTDAGSSIAQAGYSVDSDEEWRSLVADDDIFDSQSEAVSFIIKDLEPGEHRIALRVRDAQGNTRYLHRSATIGD